MKKKSFICKLSNGRNTFCIGLATVGTLLFASCAQDGYDDDERWQASVTNTQLETPKVDEIKIAASDDETKTIITWPVVHGAGGYICSLLDVSDPENPQPVDGMDEKLVDGCSITITREEDVKYRFSLRTAGNEELNNKEAETASVKEFSTFTPTYTVIPEGVDLYQWFKDNPVPEGAEAEAIKTELYAGTGVAPENIVNQTLNYDLKPGGEYRLSESLDFLGNNVVLRSSNKTEYAYLKIYGESTSFKTYTSFGLKYLNIDCSETLKGLIELSSTPDESLKGATGSGDYYNIIGTVMLSGCNINGVNGNLIYDAEKKYCLRTLMINNCKVNLTSSTLTNVNGNAVIYFKSGFANDLTIQNSTFWNTGDSDAKYFVQYNNSGRSTRAGYTTNSVTYSNCTFYNMIKSGQWSNYSGFSGQKCSIFSMTNCIFADCAKEIARRFIGGNFSTNPTYTFANNTYCQDMGTATFDNAENYDKSGTVITSVPDFRDPTNGDFTLTSSEQAEKRTGDPRWLQ